MDYKKLIESDAYSFLKTEPHLKDRILFLCVSGSHSYGTNVEGSDVDIRGVSLDTLECLIGLDHFEQFLDRETDTTVFALSKYIGLCFHCNPNVLELSYLESEHYIYVSPLGRKLLDASPYFLSQRAIPAFGGYANDQLNRLENALMRENSQDASILKLDHVKRSVENCIVSFLEAEEDEYSLNLYFDEYKSTLLADLSVKGMPIGSLRSLGNSVGDVLRTYDAKSLGKNKRKDDLHLNKHMMHLVRLYLTANELLEFGTFHTYREKDRDLLLSIRRGDYRSEDGGITQEFRDLLGGLTERFDYLKQHTVLPPKPDKEKVSEIIKEIYEEGVFRR